MDRCGGVFFMAKVGRPKVDNPKQHKVTIRMSDEEYIKLMEYNQKHDQTITETMSEAFSFFIDNRKVKA